MIKLAAFQASGAAYVKLRLAAIQRILQADYKP